MMKIKLLGVFVSGAFLLLAAVLPSEDVVLPNGDPMGTLLDDPVMAGLVAYEEAVDEFRKLENPSPAARLEHRREWRDRFQKIIAENPNSQFVGNAKDQLLSLHNGLGEFDKSQALLQEMISESTKPEEKIELYNQLGIVSRARHLGSQEQSDSQKAQEAFEQANELFLSLPSEKRGGSTGGDQILALCTAALAAREAGNQEKSATLFRSARELFQSSTESAMYAASLDYDVEIIAELEMIQWVQVKEESNALNCLEILSKVPSPRWSPSYYALKYATEWYGKDSKGFQNFVSNWLDNNAFDERTPILMARLGFSYFDDKQYEKALPIYETLRDRHRDDFQRLEPKAFQQGNGGHYERVVADLVEIYSQRNEVGKTESLMTELTTLLPDSSRAKMLKRLNPSLDESEWAPPERASYLGLRIFSAVLGAVLILLGLYLNWRKRL